MFMPFLPRFAPEDGGYGDAEQGRDTHGMAAAASWMVSLSATILTCDGRPGELDFPWVGHN
jgi:hypothetical protein